MRTGVILDIHDFQHLIIRLRKVFRAFHVCVHLIPAPIRGAGFGRGRGIGVAGDDGLPGIHLGLGGPDEVHGVHRR